MVPNPTPDSGILRKIHKLLQHAEGKGTTEAEAATAAALAADLMERHGLTRAALAATVNGNDCFLLGVAETASPDEVKAAYRKLAFEFHTDRNPNDADALAAFKRIQTAYARLTQPREKIVERAALEPDRTRAKRVPHHATLTAALCAAFDCRYFWSGGQTQLFGRESAVQSVRYLFQFLDREIERLVVPALNAACREAGRPLGAVWTRSYRLGAAGAVAARLYEQRREAQAARARVRAGERVEVEEVGVNEGAEPAAEPAAINPHALLVISPRALDVVEADEREVAEAYAKFSQGFRHAGSFASAARADAYRQGQSDGKRIAWSNARGAIGSGAARLRGK